MALLSPTTTCRLLLCSLLLMSLSPTTARSEPLTDNTVRSLLQLRQVVLEGLEQRLQKRLHQQHGELDTAQASVKRVDEDSGGGGASLGDVFAGAKAFATVMAERDAASTGGPAAAAVAAWTTTPADFEAVSSSINGTVVVLSPIAAWFAHLYSRMLLVMPLAAWIAVLVAAFLLLIGLFILLLYCCCCRNRGKFKLRGARNRREGPPQTLTYNDLDIVGKEQPPYGIINFSLEYDVPNYQLIITASSCIGLPKDLKELDPYVIIRVSSDAPEKKHHHHVHSTKPEHSKVVKNSVDPAFNYTHIVKIRDKRELKKKIITFEVYDWDIGTRHRMIARRVLNLARLGEKLDEILGRKVEFSRHLQAGVNQEPTGPGDICLALCYSPQEKHLWVHVIECKGVFLQKSEKKPDFDTLPNTYVKLVLSLAGSTKRMTKTTVMIKESRNPYFNEQFVFKMEPIQMQVATLRVVLMHRTETLRIKRVVGSLSLSLTADKESLALLHWRETVFNHGRPMARWHSLVTPEEERRQADQKAAAELKRQLELAEDQDLVRPHGADAGGDSGDAAAAAASSSEKRP